MYCARRPLEGSAGYHSETISSLAVTPGTQGSMRETSVRWIDVTPTGWGPVGFGRQSALLGSSAQADGSVARCSSFGLVATNLSVDVEDHSPHRGCP
jgi:hypothetical protein